MLYGLCMGLACSVAALCSNSQHSVPPHHLAGAPPLASPLLVDSLFVGSTGKV